MLPGYNTNGFAHHRLEDALKILVALGYRSVALTIDWHVLNPRAFTRHEFKQVTDVLDRGRISRVIETGARFFLDPWRKHEPTLLDPEGSARERRLEFLVSAMTTAKALECDIVSFWSGKALEGESEDELWKRLVGSCQFLCTLAEMHNVRLAFEPEPGMFIDTMPKFAELFERVNHPRFGLTLDVGHLCCMGEMPSRPHIERWKDVLWNVHIEDMRRGVHDHLPFGDGEIDFDEVFAALRDVEYKSGLHVELSRHSHDAVETARRSMDFLRRYLT